MTSLVETLPVLDQAVPALPGKAEAVAQGGDALEKAAREAIADFEQKRAQAAALMDQVRQALEGLREQAGEERQHIEEASHALQDATGQEVHDIEDESRKLKTDGDEVGTAFGGLQSALAQTSERARAAHEEARAALDELGNAARSKQSELDGAVDEMTAAVRSAEEAVREGETLVAKGVSALSAAMSRLLEEARARLEQTRTRLDELRAEQETAVGEALSEVETEGGQIEQELTGRLDSDLEQPIAHELEGLMGALGEMGQQVLKLQADCGARREDLEQQFAAVADRIPPLEGGVQQVKRAADEVGIPWP